MKGVKFTDLQAVLNFMYHGEVNVAQEELNSFLAVAEDLRVKGLTQNQSSSNESSSKKSTSQHQSRSPPPLPRTLKRAPEREHPAQPPKRTQQPPAAHDDDIQEVVPIKSEPLSTAPLPSHHADPQVYRPAPPPVLDPTPHQDQAVATYQEEEAGYEDYGEYQDQGYNEIDNTMDQSMAMQGVQTGKGI